jgi:uncharacterized protein YndB with AHSA1/START domain
MRVLIIVVIALISIVVLLLIVAIFVKKEYEIKREITINKPSSRVFDYIKFVKNQEQYSKWVMADPGMKKEFTGVDGQPGFVYAWESNDKQVGQGEQEIKRMKEGESIDLEIRFVKPFKNVGLAEMKTEPVAGGQTKVTWGMSGKSVYPMNITNLFIDGILGKDIETSLHNLKNILEKQP